MATERIEINIKAEIWEEALQAVYYSMSLGASPEVALILCRKNNPYA